MRRVSIVLTAENEERFSMLVEQTGMNPNRLLNAMIRVAVVEPVERREPVVVVQSAQEGRHA